MPEIDRSLRARAFLNSWYVVVAVALVITTLVLGWWAYQVNVVPDVQQEERVVAQWSESTEYNHSAVIVNDSIPFEEGETVVNRPIYYTNLTREIDGTHQYVYQAESGDLTVTTEAFLLIREGEVEEGEMVETFWQVVRPLSSERTESLAPGEVHSTDYTIDIRYVLGTIETVQEQVGAREGLVDVRVVTVTTVDGQAAGGEVTHTYESDMIMVFDPATVRIAGFDLVDEQHQTTETVQTIARPSPLVAYGSILLFVLSAGLLLALLAGRYTGYVELTEDEKELVQLEQYRNRFSEWITAGRFPSEREYEQTVLVDDLEGLIDVAIDTNKRVIEDQQLGVSVVLDNEYVYLYVRPDSPARDWLVNYADTNLDEFDPHQL